MTRGRLAPAFLAALLFFAGAACSKKSDEDLIRAKVQAALSAVNDKKPGAVVADASEDFQGPRKMDLRETRRIITGYLLTQGWVRAFPRSLEVEVEADKAHVDLEVVLARGKPIEKLEDVVPTNATVLDMDLELERRGGEWKFVRGAYRTVRF